MMQSTLLQRSVQRVRHELRIRNLVVLRIEQLNEEFIRVVMGGSELDGFVSLGFDDHVKFIFEDPNGGPPIRRDYTPRHFNALQGELTIDFAIHGPGKASSWARQASVGQRVVIGGPRGSMIIPTSYDWQLLCGDATAVPAIGRRLAELPANVTVMVVVLIEDIAPLQVEYSKASVQLIRVETAADAIAAVEQLQFPAAPGFAWCAGEAALMSGLRDVLVGDKRLSKDEMRIAAYWKRGAPEFHKELMGPD